MGSDPTQEQEQHGEDGTPTNVAGSPAEASTGAVEGEQSGSESSGEAANPELEDANVGSQGEQVPVDATGVDQSRAVAQSPPPPSAQSGVPLQEDRDAGVEAGPAGPITPGQEATERDAEAE